jgi:hypothetical protein
VVGKVSTRRESQLRGSNGHGKRAPADKAGPLQHAETSVKKWILIPGKTGDGVHPYGKPRFSAQILPYPNFKEIGSVRSLQQ